MAKPLFTFVQMEFPWELGPPDGRYLLRKGTGPHSGEPEHVVVLSTVGATRRGLFGRRARTRPTDPEPAPVPVAKATVVDVVALSAEGQARAWMADLDPERDAAWAANVVNGVLFAHRIASASAHVHEVSPRQALVIRAGFGEGEQVAEGVWTDARELALPHGGAARRRAGALRPQERLAALLAGRGEALVCEELTLRARGDLDSDRLLHAAIELDRAYEMALAELPRLRRNDLERRIEELRDLAPQVGEAAAGAIRAVSVGSADGAGPDESQVRHALERLEAALRARSAAGIA